MCWLDLVMLDAGVCRMSDEQCRDMSDDQYAGEQCSGDPDEQCQTGSCMSARTNMPDEVCRMNSTRMNSATGSSMSVGTYTFRGMSDEQYPDEQYPG